MRNHILTLLLFSFFVNACASRFKEQEITEIETKKIELDGVVKVTQAAPIVPVVSAPVVTNQSPVPPVPTLLPKLEKKTNKKKIKSQDPKPAAVSTQPEVKKRLPEYEDSEGFNNERRPLIDPFRVGEKVTLDINYLSFSAGELIMEIPEMKMVNGRLAYQMITRIKSHPAFSRFVYEADDWSETMMDFEYLAPSVFSLHVRESGQMKEGKAVFDMLGGKARNWETKISKKKGKQEKDNTWDILPYSQNVFSAAFYMRLFKWEIGKEYQFNVADDKENIMFKGKALRKEKLSTAIGEIDTIVVKPEFTAKGVFKPVGDIYFWLTDDDQKQIVRLEASIKIGTLVAELRARENGTPVK